MRNWNNRFYILNKNSRWLNILWSLFCFICFFLSPSSISQGCGVVDRGFRGYSFINPSIVNLEAKFAPYFISFNTIFQDFYLDAAEEQAAGNVNEWHQRYCKRASVTDIDFVVYTATIREMRQLRTAALSSSAQIDYKLSKNSFARYLVRHKCVETIEYLTFAKRCEPHVIRRDPWEAPEQNVKAMMELIKDGRRHFLDVESHYIRLRYAYQLIRLAHYAKKYELALELYDYLMPKIDNDPSIIDYWILGHKAGALMGLKKNVEAAYLYAIIFNECQSKRESAFQSFTIRTNDEWEACLKLCKSDLERANIYVLRANSTYGLPYREMEKIYDLEPKHPQLELLLVRELIKLEKDLLGYDFNPNKAYNKRYYKIPRTNAGAYIIDLQTFVRRVIQENQVNRPELWIIAEAYLELLAGDFYQAQLTFEKAESAVDNPLLAEQLAAMWVVLDVCALTKMDDESEEKVADILESRLYTKYPHFKDLIADKLFKLYNQQGNPGKAFRCKYPLDDLRPNPELPLIEDLLLVTEKPRTTSFENYILSRNDSTIQRALWDMKATSLMSENQFEEAMATYRLMDRATWKEFGTFNPFVEKFDECINCPIPEGAIKITKGEIIERLLDLEYTAKADRNKLDVSFYELGMALYNMSYFGYEWEVTDYFRSGASLMEWRLKDGDNIIPHYRFPLGNRENFDLSRALYYFDNARTFTDSLELGAKATFMAARCEQNEYYIKRAQGAQRTYKYFDLLMENYQETDFFNRIIEECLYFQFYATR